MSKKDHEERDETPLKHGEEDEWEVVEPEHAPLSAILTVRFSHGEFNNLRDAAKRADSTMAEIVRAAVRRYVLGGEGTPDLIFAGTNATHFYGLIDIKPVTYGLGISSLGESVLTSDTYRELLSDAGLSYDSQFRVVTEQEDESESEAEAEAQPA